MAHHFIRPLLSTTLLLLIRTRPARGVGVVTCISALIGQADNDTLLQIHYPAYYDGLDTYYGPAEPSSCDALIDRPPAGVSNWNGGGTPVRLVSGTFWITNDGCMNVLLQGLHEWCCPPLITPGDWSVTTCSLWGSQLGG